MKLALAIVLNAGLAVLLWRWLLPRLQEPGLGRWLLPLLGFKLLAWAAASWHPSIDARHMQDFSKVFTLNLWENIGVWANGMLGDEVHYQQYHLVYHGHSNTFFMAKVLSVLSLASCGSSWLNGLYLSMGCFVACWELARALAQAFPQAPAGAALVGFLAWPTVVFWSAGITKESLVLGSAAALLALLLGWLYSARPITVRGFILFLLLAVLHFKMRYFFAALLFGALSGLVVVRVAQLLVTALRRETVILLFAATVSIGIWAGSEVSLVFRLNRITIQLARNYNELHRKSVGKPTITFSEFRPTPESVVHNAPQAMLEAISRPWFWEGGLAYQAAGAENLLLLVAVAVAVVATLRGRAGKLPFALVLALAFYCVLLAALLGLSTPNLGTLSRYRAVLSPFILLLALQNDFAARWLRRLGL
jgi:hypothetical protein